MDIKLLVDRLEIVLIVRHQDQIAVQRVARHSVVVALSRRDMRLAASAE
jgi:hypothetical protein